MEERPRLKRPDPERAEPIRNWSNMYRHPEPAPAHNAAEAPDSAARPSGGGFGETVASGVELGYRVIEEQIRLGQRVAQQVNDRSYDTGAMSGDLREVAERMLRFYTDLGTLWFGLVNSFAGVAGAARQQPADSANGAGGVSLEVIATQPAHVTLDLRAPANMPLLVYELRAPDAQCPPLTDVKLEPSSDGRSTCLRLRVPPAHPAGLYSGVIVDGGGMVHGTVSVRIAAAGASSAPS